MDDNNIQMQIREVEREIVKDQPLITIKKNSIFNNKLVLLLCFVVIFFFILFQGETSSIDIEADANHIISQAHHEVIDYFHRYGVLPDEVQNPALQPYISIRKKEGNRFDLICTIEDQIIVKEY